MCKLRDVSLATATLCCIMGLVASACADLQIGISRIDITPTVDRDHVVYIAGYGWNRKATGVHDPLYARSIVLSDGQKRIALVSVDVVGLQYPLVQRIRAAIPKHDFDYVMISSSHNHEGPDTIGIWGPNPFRRGTDGEYLSSLVQKIVECVRIANESLTDVTASYGSASDESLIRDSRKPIVKDATLRLLRFQSGSDDKVVGLLVQWNSHPEALGPDNTLITADFPHATIRQLEEKYNCPVVYFSGAVGGLMAPPRGLFRDENGELLKEGDFTYAEAYGIAVAKLAEEAVQAASPIELTPFAISASPIAIHVKNPLYRAAAVARVVKRDRVKWMGDFDKANVPVDKDTLRDEMCVQTEVGYLKLGQLSAACIPGEIYPELVYGRFQDPPDPNADFPNAPLEKHVTQILPDGPWLLFGLANDEIGYIIPKRQWDRSPPFAYGRKKSQYGEINSCGSNIAPIIMEALERRVAEVDK
ncbi:MAG: neutral/alkaline non-lysosomal ceramidase N-terminal domain-containing protein [Planctomycetales bacterium]|nr:neutral/alkaline non-lysosomal ceramidase N-terminal domain-containing protein [Planctomycetales bacterium]